MALKIEFASLVALTPLGRFHLVRVLYEPVLFMKRVAEKLFSSCSHFRSELERALSTVGALIFRQSSFDHGVVMALRQGQPKQLVVVRPVKHLFLSGSRLRTSPVDIYQSPVKRLLLATLQWR